MTPQHSKAQVRAESYAEAHGKQLGECLGWGHDGVVFETDDETAIKALLSAELHQRERDAYLRLSEYDVDTVHGFAVPKLVGFDNSLWIVEMGIVSPPCVLDFAGALVDIPVEFPEEIMIEWERSKRDEFGDRWPTVRLVLATFRGMGIHLTDISPNNVMFREGE